MTSTLRFYHVDENAKKYTEKISTNISVATLTKTTAGYIDTWARAMVALTYDSFYDSEITSVQSLNEYLAG